MEVEKNINVYIIKRRSKNETAFRWAHPKQGAGRKLPGLLMRIFAHKGGGATFEIIVRIFTIDILPAGVSFKIPY